MDDFIKLYPVKACEHEEKKNLITVLLKDPKVTFIEKIFFKKYSGKIVKLDLDEIGSFVWLLCDGKKDVEKIINLAVEKFAENINPAAERVVLFLKQMSKNKMIILFRKKEEENISQIF